MNQRLSKLLLILTTLVWAIWVAIRYLFLAQDFFSTDDMEGLVHLFIAFLFAAIAGVTSYFFARKYVRLNNYVVVFLILFLPVILSILPIVRPMSLTTYYYDKAIQAMDEKFCSKIPDAKTYAIEDYGGVRRPSENRCYIDLAELKRDYLICDYINGEEYSGNKEMCLRPFIEETQNASICGKIPEKNWLLRNKCYSLVASKRQDISLCEYVIDNPMVLNIHEHIACIASVSVEKAVQLCARLRLSKYECEVSIKEGTKVE